MLKIKTTNLLIVIEQSAKLTTKSERYFKILSMVREYVWEINFQIVELWKQIDELYG